MNFSDFLPKIKTIQSLKVDFSDFLGKIWFQGFWAKRGKMGQEWGFSSFVKNEQLNFFWIKLQWHISLILTCSLCCTYYVQAFDIQF